MSRKKQFTVSFFGRGRLLGIVVADGLKAYPHSTWYDYSDAARKGIRQEHSIAKSGHMDPRGVPSVMRGMANQKSPRPTDVVLTFAYAAGTDRVKVAARRTAQSFILNEKTTKLKDPYFTVARQIVSAIGRMV